MTSKVGLAAGPLRLRPGGARRSSRSPRRRQQRALRSRRLAAMFIGVPVLLNMLAALSLRKYPLDEKRQTELAAAIDARHARDAALNLPLERRAARSAPDAAHRSAARESIGGSPQHFRGDALAEQRRQRQPARAETAQHVNARRCAGGGALAFGRAAVREAGILREPGRRVRATNPRPAQNPACLRASAARELSLFGSMLGGELRRELRQGGEIARRARLRCAGFGGGSLQRDRTSRQTAIRHRTARRNFRA